MLSSQEPSHWKHHSTEVAPGVKLHHVDVQPSSSKANGRSIVLIHGYPQTWYSWRHVMQPLADAGFRVIAVDYRGAGDSSHPENGYDKLTMAKDIHALYYEKLGIKKAVVIGFDIGSMVAVALAFQFQDHVEALIKGEAPLPGTEAFEHVCSSHETKWTVLFHFFFHNAPDNLAESLTVGREKLYIKHFYDRLCYDPSFLSVEDENVYASKFEKPGAMRSGFETYRAFRQDTFDTQNLLKEKGKLSLPVLLVAGEASLFTKASYISHFVEGMTKEVADDVTYKTIPGSCHWMAEENPEALVKEVTAFLK